MFVGMVKRAFFAVVVCAKSHSQAFIFWKQEDFSTKWAELWTTSTRAKQYLSEACLGNDGEVFFDCKEIPNCIRHLAKKVYIVTKL